MEGILNNALRQIVQSHSLLQPTLVYITYRMVLSNVCISVCMLSVVCVVYVCVVCA